MNTHSRWVWDIFSEMGRRNQQHKVADVDSDMHDQHKCPFKLPKIQPNKNEDKLVSNTKSIYSGNKTLQSIYN
jgi:hypothetical protein